MLAAAAVLLLFLTGCGRRSASAPLPDGPARVTVTMRENAFEFDRFPDKRAISFRVVNRGAEKHDLTLLQIPEDLQTSLDAQLRSPERLYVVPIVEVKVRGPGQESLFAVDLRPGRFGVVCFVRDADGTPHARKGMSAEFRVT